MIAPFPFSPDWASPIKERIQYKTQRTTGRTGMEQRARLRTRPRRGLSFSLLNADPLETQACDSLLWSRSGSLFAVPWWPEQVQYSGALAQGATQIAIDTTNRLFAVAPLVMVWSSWDKCEVQTVESVSASLVTLSALSMAHTNPIILPTFPGRLQPSVSLDRVTSALSRVPVEFACEVGVGDPRPSLGAMTQVYGFDVLEVAPNGRDERRNSVRRVLATMDNGIAQPVVRDRGLVSFQNHEFHWFIENKADAKALRDFVDRRAGSWSPFWVPTWRQDLTVAQNANAVESGLLVKDVGYTTRMFPDRARRYIAIRNGAGWIYRKVTSATAAGGVETVGLDSALGVNIAAGTAISFLVLCRLDSDDVEIGWHTDLVGESVTPITELPKEVPA